MYIPPRLLTDGRSMTVIFIGGGCNVATTGAAEYAVLLESCGTYCFCNISIRLDMWILVCEKYEANESKLWAKVLRKPELSK